MKAGASNNLQEVLSGLDDVLPSRPHRATLRNSMEYAAALHAKHGYYIFNAAHFMKEVRKSLNVLAGSGRKMSDRNVRLALEIACLSEINYLRSETSEMRPPSPVNSAGRYLPVSQRGGERAAHPTGWADRTGNAANAYSHDVD